MKDTKSNTSENSMTKSNQKAATVKQAETRTPNMKNNSSPVNVETQFKAGIINFSGNVGKTTLKRFLLEPRMELEANYSIESINKDGKESDEDIIVRGDKFEDIQRSLLALDSVLVDIGASNVEQTMRYLNRIEGSYEDFDYFIVPVVKSPKQLRDSVTTIHELLKLGVEPGQIKIVFNMVDDLDNVEVEFEDLIFALNEFNIPYTTEAAILYTEFYPNFDNLGISLNDLLSTDVKENKKELKALKAKLKTPEGFSDKDQDRHDQLIELITTQRYAKTAMRNLEKAYISLFKV